MKSIFFNGDLSYRIAKTDFNHSATIFMPNTQSEISEDEKLNADTLILEKSRNIVEKLETENKLFFIKDKFSSL